MSNFITAQEARILSGPTKSDYLEKLESMIKSAAENQKRKVIVRDSMFADWLYSPEKMTDSQKETINALHEAGYETSLHYHESQFVDMGLVISWEGGSK